VLEEEDEAAITQAIENGTIDVKDDVAAFRLLSSETLMLIGASVVTRRCKSSIGCISVLAKFNLVLSAQSLPCVIFDQDMGNKMRKLN
jgi:hypothetical protein